MSAPLPASADRLVWASSNMLQSILAFLALTERACCLGCNRVFRAMGSQPRLWATLDLRPHKTRLFAADIRRLVARATGKLEVLRVHFGTLPLSAFDDVAGHLRTLTLLDIGMAPDSGDDVVAFVLCLLRTKQSAAPHSRLQVLLGPFERASAVRRRLAAATVGLLSVEIHVSMPCFLCTACRKTFRAARNAWATKHLVYCNADWTAVEAYGTVHRVQWFDTAANAEAFRVRIEAAHRQQRHDTVAELIRALPVVDYHSLRGDTHVPFQ